MDDLEIRRRSKKYSLSILNSECYCFSTHTYKIYCVQASSEISKRSGGIPASSQPIDFQMEISSSNSSSHNGTSSEQLNSQLRNAIETSEQLNSQLRNAIEKIRKDEDEIKRLNTIIETQKKSIDAQVVSTESEDSVVVTVLDEEKDDQEIIDRFFSELDADSSGSISQSELNKAIEQHRDHSELVSALQILIDESESNNLDIESFRSMIRNVPRVSGQRVQWARSLGLEKALAKHLPAGTLFDGLMGIKSMDEAQISAACQRFSRDVVVLVMRQWAVLKQTSVSRASEAEEANSKFAMTEGAYVGSFGTLDEFYQGPEARIGYPNPKLREAMLTEHCVRPNARRLFTTPNYVVTTCPEWEWQWVLDPDRPASEALLHRLQAADGKYPGEAGDRASEVELQFSVEVRADTSPALVRSLDEDLSGWVEQAVLESDEERSRGVRTVATAALSQGAARMAVTLPMSQRDFSARQERFVEAVRHAACTGVGAVEVSRVVERSWVYCEHVDAASLRQALLARLKTSTPEEWRAYLRRGWPSLSDDEVKMTGKACVDLVVRGFETETEEWRRSAVMRKQGRLRAGALQELLLLPEVKATADKAGLIAEEAAALRLYTGPMYLLYNAKLRNFPPRTVRALEGNRYETTIFAITSGITKLSRVTAIPPGRLLYRGLGGMLLPECFWRVSAAGFQGGVEYGLMSTTTDKAVAVHYSGLDKRRAIIFEIMAGRVDIGGSLRFVSQYPGEDEFLMQPLSCLEVSLPSPLSHSRGVVIFTL